MLRDRLGDLRRDRTQASQGQRTLVLRKRLGDLRCKRRQTVELEPDFVLGQRLGDLRCKGRQAVEIERAVEYRKLSCLPNIELFDLVRVPQPIRRPLGAVRQRKSELVRKLDMGPGPERFGRLFRELPQSQHGHHSTDLRQRLGRLVRQCPDTAERETEHLRRCQRLGNLWRERL